MKHPEKQYELYQKFGSDERSELWLARRTNRPALSVLGKRDQPTHSETQKELFHVKKYITNDQKPSGASDPQFELRQIATEYNVYKNHSSESLAQVEELVKMDDNSFWLILSFQNGGSLFDLIRERAKAFDLSEIKPLLIQLVMTLQSLHNRGLVHKDIKPTNFLLHFKRKESQNINLVQCYVREATKCEVKLGNLIYVDQVDKETRIAKSESLSGTDWYYAPEMLDQWFEYDRNDPSFKYTQKVDIWALGAILCQMMTGQHPFANSRFFIEFAQMALASHGSLTRISTQTKIQYQRWCHCEPAYILQLPDPVSPSLILLLQRMLCSVEADRFELFEVNDHVFLRGKAEVFSLSRLKQSSWSQYFDQEGRFNLSKTEMIFGLPTEIKN